MEILSALTEDSKSQLHPSRIRDAEEPCRDSGDQEEENVHHRYRAKTPEQRGLEKSKNRARAKVAAKSKRKNRK